MFTSAMLRFAQDLGRDGLRHMFMKIDANGDGSVDWDEFSTYMLLQNQGKQAMLENETHAEYTEPEERTLTLEQEQPKTIPPTQGPGMP
eukprot:5958934-Pyramimonas_sp.AAC.1